jgi:tetratricopeptide (TPR) repeat protein
MDKGLPISGKISRDRRTIEWVGKDSQGIQYTSIVYKEEQEESKEVSKVEAKAEPKVEAKAVPVVEAKEEPKVSSNRQFTQEVDLGFAAYKNKQYDEAISHHEKALQIDPGNKDAFKVYCALGANYFRKGLLDEALNKAQKCLELNANYGVGNGFMGDILSRRGNRTSACMYYKKGCDLGTDFSCNNYKSQCLNK